MPKKSTSKMKRKSGNGKSHATKSMAAKKWPQIKDPMTKSAMIRAITDVSSCHRKEVIAILDCLTQVIEKHVKSGGPGTFVMPGLMKITVIKKPATKAREGINPFTGEKIMIKAKPARRVVKIRALKKLKEMVI